MERVAKARIGRLPELVLGLGFAAYLIVLYRLTLTPADGVFLHARQLNLVPFRSLTAMFTNGGIPFSQALFQLVGNVMMLAPLGTLLAVVPAWLGGRGARGWIPRLSLWQVALVGLAVSGGIEVTQYLLATGRVADVDDVICNVSGMVLTYLLVCGELRRSEARRVAAR